MCKYSAIEMLDKLEEMYPNAKCELEYSTPFQLLVAVILSAQCTDVRVNKVTAKLFKVAATAEEFVQMGQELLEQQIFSCGFYHNKAKNILSACKDIIEKFGGEVPKSREQLETLGGVGRKTASVVISEAFGGNAIAVDTHVFRVSKRLGLASGKSVEVVERELMAALPENLYSRAHHLMIFHGRYCCSSQRPNCSSCALQNYCIEREKFL